MDNSNTSGFSGYMQTVPTTITPQPCPSCGHCPTCGRGRQQWTYPPYSTGPWYQQPVVYPLTTSSGLLSTTEASYKNANHARSTK